MSQKKLDGKISDYFFKCIGGNVNQTQNCDINVEQPNNNVICSKDTTTNQNNNKSSTPEKKLMKDEIGNKNSNEGQEEYHYDYKQNNKANQYGMQANANVYNSETTVGIKQGNDSKQKNS